MLEITCHVGPSLTFDDKAVNLNMSGANEVLVEAVVASRSKLVGHTLKEAHFRATYEAAVRHLWAAVSRLFLPYFLFRGVVSVPRVFFHNNTVQYWECCSN